MSNYNVIKPSVVRAIAKSCGRRVSKDFIVLLNNYVCRKIEDCANTHNGTKKTIDCAVAGYNGIR